MRTNTLIATVSAATDVNSIGYELADLTSYSIGVNFSGANVVGTLTLEACNDMAADGSGSWVTISGSSQSVTASADHLWSVTGAGYRYVRVVWDYTSGTGNITVTLVAKENRVIGA